MFYGSMFLWFLGFIFFLVFLGFLLEKGLNKLLGIEKKKISETPGKKVDRWGRGIILVIFLSTLPIVVTMDTNIIKWYWTVYLALLLGFQSFLEWKYLKKSKQYIATLIFLTFGVIIMSNIEYLISLFR
ncbi:hypothetical protein CWR48_05670 [Oceanobacillus arenosus]|uniref:DUF4181 domain-containing protein n=1 Tax=Oceanobacillus arenosus TaxID=1229153 RepID=A0A3D8PVX5_9BACI|nr:DUF4181 domain-containing protein [Oceanobacillus arenosus]RDW20194.1 hypothetical protein CWR48_05670 [Oceanobacillus arenosus]